MFRSVAWIALLAGGFAAAAQAAPKKPNVLIILADDLGYADLSVQGCKQFKTPNIDRIFNEGVRFTQGYVANSVCAPSRAGLLTGRMGSSFGFESNLNHDLSSKPGSTVGLPLDQKTIADVLKAVGYENYCIGKWHLGDNQKLFHPLKRGFDAFCGLISGSRSYWALEKHDPIKTLMVDYGYMDEGQVEDFYVTDVLTDKAIHYLETRQKDQPFFMYLSYTAPHGPLEAKDDVLERLDYDFKNPKRKIYAGMVVNMDDNVGRVLNCLDDLGISENTLIVFLSDNGGPTDKNSSSNWPLRGMKGQLFEGGVRVPFGVCWKGTIPPGQVNNEPVISLDLLPTFAAISGADKKTTIETDGLNLMPLLMQRTGSLPGRTFYWRRGEKTQVAIREGKFKYHQNRRKGEEFLWNIEDDIGEKNNLVKEHPELASRMRAQYEKWETTLPPLGVGIGAPAPDEGKKSQKRK